MCVLFAVRNTAVSVRACVRGDFAAADRFRYCRVGYIVAYRAVTHEGKSDPAIRRPGKLRFSQVLQPNIFPEIQGTSSDFLRKKSSPLRVISERACAAVS